MERYNNFAPSFAHRVFCQFCKNIRIYDTGMMFNRWPGCFFFISYDEQIYMGFNWALPAVENDQQVHIHHVFSSDPLPFAHEFSSERVACHSSNTISQYIYSCPCRWCSYISCMTEFTGIFDAEGRLIVDPPPPSFHPVFSSTWPNTAGCVLCLPWLDISWLKQLIYWFSKWIFQPNVI